MFGRIVCETDKTKELAEVVQDDDLHKHNFADHHSV